MADDAYVEELLSDLQGFTLDQGQLTWLTQELSDSATTMTVEEGAQVFRGVVEVGEELVYVRSSNQSNGVVTVAPFGRGYMGSTKSAWPIGTRVTFSPRFPRHRVRKAINETITSVYPQLFAVGVHEIQPDPTKVTYSLPAEARMVLNVRQKTVGPSEFWRTLETYSIRREEGLTEINLMRGVGLTQPIRVTYAKRPTKIGPGDEFTDSGLSDTAWEAIKFGAMFRLVSVQEAGSSGREPIDLSDGRSRQQSPTALARQYFAAHQQLLLEERTRLLSEHEIVNNQEYV